MSVHVELFGIPRQRAGVARTTAEGSQLGQVLGDLAARFPRLAEACFEAGRLKRPYAANLNGLQFVADPATRVEPGDSLLIFSADAGG